jgi:hypothetical protein
MVSRTNSQGKGGQSYALIPVVERLDNYFFAPAETAQKALFIGWNDFRDLAVQRGINDGARTSLT